MRGGLIASIQGKAQHIASQEESVTEGWVSPFFEVQMMISWMFLIVEEISKGCVVQMNASIDILTHPEWNKEL